MVLPRNMCYHLNNFKPPIARNDVLVWNDDTDTILSSCDDSFISSIDSDDLFTSSEEEDDNESIGANPASSVNTILGNDIEEVIKVIIIMTMLLIGFAI